MRKGLVGALLVTVLLALYGIVLVDRGLRLIQTGEPVGIGLGIGVLVLPLIVLWALWREYSLAIAAQRMADELAQRGELPVDDLPRSPGGRIDRAAADADFAQYRTAVEEQPDDWGAWYRLAFAYDAAGDSRRRRESLRRAAGLYRAK